MRPQLVEIQELEAYLHGTLSGQRRMTVEIRLLWDREWQQALAAQKMAYKALKEAGRHQLHRELTALHERLFG